MGEYVHARVQARPRVLNAKGDLTKANLINDVAPSSLSGHQPRLVDVVLQNDVEPSKVLVPIATAAHLDPNTLVAGTHKFRISVQRRVPQGRRGNRRGPAYRGRGPTEVA